MGRVCFLGLHTIEDTNAHKYCKRVWGVPAANLILDSTGLGDETRKKDFSACRYHTHSIFVNFKDLEMALLEDGTTGDCRNLAPLSSQQCPQRCHSSCLTCDGDSCLSCPAGSRMLWGLRCVACHETCQSCDGPSSEDCTSCYNGGHLYEVPQLPHSCEECLEDAHCGERQWCYNAPEGFNQNECRAWVADQGTTAATTVVSAAVMLRPVMTMLSALMTVVVATFPTRVS